MAVGLCLSSVTLVVAQTPPTTPAGPFEALPHVEASAILPGSLLQGANHRVQDRVNNDGYYNHYRINTSEVGVFDAITTRTTPAAIRASEQGGVRPWCAHGSRLT